MFCKNLTKFCTHFERNLESYAKVIEHFIKKFEQTVLVGNICISVENIIAVKASV